MSFGHCQSVNTPAFQRLMSLLKVNMHQGGSKTFSIFAKFSKLLFMSFFVLNSMVFTFFFQNVLFSVRLQSIHVATFLPVFDFQHDL